MARTTLLLGLLTASLLAAPLARAGPVLPPLEEAKRVVAHLGDDHIVVGGICPQASTCVPTYCIPPGAECNPADVIGDIIGDVAA